MLVRVTIFLLVFTLMITGLTGCWDLREPNQLLFIIGSGIDKSNDGKIELSLQAPIPIQGGSQQGGGGGDSKPFVVYSSKGKNIMDAESQIMDRSSRKLFGGHRIVVLIDEELAKLGMTQYLDELIRFPDNNTRAGLLIVKGMTAKQFLEGQYKFEKYSSLAAIQTSDFIGYKATIFEFQREMNNPVKYTILPVIEPVSKDEFKIHTIAILNKEHKLYKYLENKEATFALTAADKLPRGVVITEFISQGQGTISVDLRKVHSHVKVNLNSKLPSASISITGKGSFSENNTSLDLRSPAVIESVTKEMSRKIENDVKQVINIVQKQYKSDIFSIGNTIAREHPSKWKKIQKNWDDTFSKMPVSVDVHLSIRGGGLIGSGPKHKE